MAFSGWGRTAFGAVLATARALVPPLLAASFLVPAAALAGGGIAGEDAFSAAEKLAAKGHRKTALKYYAKAQERGDARAAERIAATRERLETDRDQELLDEGRRLLAAKRYRDAEKALRAAVARPRPRVRAEAHFLLGDLYLAQEKYARAKEEYRASKSAR